MNRFSLIALTLALPAYGSIVENINRTTHTFNYYVKDGKVFQEKCSGRPTSTLEDIHCKPYGPDGVAIEKVKENVVKGAAADLKLVQKNIVEMEKSLAKYSSQLKEIEGLIAKLIAQSPVPPEITEYRKREKEISARIEVLRAEIAIETKSLEGADQIFGHNEMLEQNIVHPISQGSKDYATVRVFAKQLYHGMMAEVGKRYGKNSWYDVETGHVWFSSLKQGQWPVISNLCPKGYHQPIPSLEYSDESAANRLRIADTHDETGFAGYVGCGAHMFWGGKKRDALHPLDAVRLRTDDAGPQAWQYIFFDESVWITGSSLNVSNLVLLCVSKDADPK